jgi:hypothetical protein
VTATRASLDGTQRARQPRHQVRGAAATGGGGSSRTTGTQYARLGCAMRVMPRSRAAARNVTATLARRRRRSCDAARCMGRGDHALGQPGWRRSPNSPTGPRRTRDRPPCASPSS